jgi:hypothetical protein
MPLTFVLFVSLILRYMAVINFLSLMKRTQPATSYLDYLYHKHVGEVAAQARLMANLLHIHLDCFKQRDYCLYVYNYDGMN